MESRIVTATKEFTWDMAHMLTGHEGLCQNLHGHTYRMLVTVTRTQNYTITDATNPSNGMVVDFKDLKTTVNKVVVDLFDHALVVDESVKEGFEYELTNLAYKYHKKMVTLSYRPTAELMAQDIFNRLTRAWSNTGIVLLSIRLYETPTSYAEVSI